MRRALGQFVLVALIAAACADMPPTSSAPDAEAGSGPASSTPTDIRAATIPFGPDVVEWLGLRPADVAGTEYSEPSRDNGEWGRGADWQAHLDEHGLQGRWLALLQGPNAFLVSRVSLWADADAAVAAMAYESGRADAMPGDPIGPREPMGGLNDAAWCQRFDRGNLADWLMCRFQVSNATVEVYARQGTGSLGESYGDLDLVGIARAVLERMARVGSP